jgi:uncharacterized protein (TIGR04255 family)
MTRPGDLPDYRKPPIDEVALGVQFDALSGFTDAHTGLLWQRVRDLYPRTQSRPRADVPIVSLTHRQMRPPILIEPVDQDRSSRTFLVSEDDDSLLQIQDSQFLYNWRRRGGEYPHLDHVRERFWAGFDEFTRMLEDERIDPPRVRQLEVSYFNWIPGVLDGAFLRARERVTLPIDGLRETPEDLAFLATYLDDEDDSPIARLGIECAPAVRAPAGGRKGQEGSRFVLSYKAPFKEPPERERLDYLMSRAREVIVRGFTELTTADAQERWERYQ